VTDIAQISSSEYAIDGHLSRFAWIPRNAKRSLFRRVRFRDPDAADRCGGVVEGEGLCQGEALGGR